MMKEIKNTEEEEKLALLDYDCVDTPGKSLTETCEHTNSGWYKNKFICANCGLVLKKES